MHYTITYEVMGDYIFKNVYLLQSLLQPKLLVMDMIHAIHPHFWMLLAL